ncbi:MAG: hypothetical protein MJ085_01135, partial [Clostridia bacterium]|nr:hypothetical protein [Clostridia bacterium]
RHNKADRQDHCQGQNQGKHASKMFAHVLSSIVLFSAKNSGMFFVLREQTSFAGVCGEKDCRLTTFLSDSFFMII